MTQAILTFFYSKEWIGGGAVGGTLNSFETDENGNVYFNPQGFLKGFVYGAAGTKAVKLALQKSPALRKKAENFLSKSGEAIREGLQNSNLPQNARNAVETALGKKLTQMLDTRQFIIDPNAGVAIIKDETNKALKSAQNKISQARQKLAQIDTSKLTAEQNEVLKVFKGELPSANITGKDLNDIHTLEQGSRQEGARKILIKHYGVEKTGGLSDDELLGMSEIIQKGHLLDESFELKNDFIRYAYELEKNGTKLRLIVDEYNNGKKIFDLYSDRNFIGDNKPNLPNPDSEILAQNAKQSQVDISDRIKNLLEYHNLKYQYHLGTLLNKDYYEKGRISSEIYNKLNNAYLQNDRNLKHKGDFRIDGHIIYVNPKSTPEQINKAINAFLNTPELEIKRDAVFAKTAYKYKNMNDKQIKDLLDFQANSHAFTKDKNGVPREFYHGGAKDIEIFDNDKSGYGFFFSTAKKEAESYFLFGKQFYKVFLSMKKPFEMDKITINSFDEYKKVLQDLGVKDIENGDYKYFLENKEYFNKVKERAKENGLKLTELNTNYAGFIGKNGYFYSVQIPYDNTYPHLAQLFSDIKRPGQDEWARFTNFTRNELDCAILSVSEEIGEYTMPITLKELLQKQGYDGIIFNDFQVSVFEPNQIKAVKNQGSWTDSVGNITKDKPNTPSDKGGTANANSAQEPTHKYFNENSPNILMSKDWIGGGLAGGTLNSFETDENGNVYFNPQGFLKGFVYGAAGTKAVKFALENPKIKAQAEKFATISRIKAKNTAQK